MRSLLVLGAGGHAKVVIEAALSAGGFRIDWVVDETCSGGPSILGFPVLNQLPDVKPDCFIVAIGNNRARRREFLRLCGLGWEPATIVHSSAVVSPSAVIGRGSAIMALSNLCADAVLGENVIVSALSSVPHDTVIGDHVLVSAGVNLGGATRVGEGVLLGVGCRTLPKANVGSWSTVGVGAVVISDVPDGATVAGVPARVIGSGVALTT